MQIIRRMVISRIRQQKGSKEAARNRLVWLPREQQHCGQALVQSRQLPGEPNFFWAPTSFVVGEGMGQGAGLGVPLPAPGSPTVN